MCEGLGPPASADAVATYKSVSGTQSLGIGEVTQQGGHRRILVPPTQGQGAIDDKQSPEASTAESASPDVSKLGANGSD
jgi:hypothetical protein